MTRLNTFINHKHVNHVILYELVFKHVVFVFVLKKIDIYINYIVFVSNIIVLYRVNTANLTYDLRVHFNALRSSFHSNINFTLIVICFY